MGRSRYKIALPVIGAYFNSSGSDGGRLSCEWSVRYYVTPSTGEEVRQSPAMLKQSCCPLRSSQCSHCYAFAVSGPLHV